MILALVLEVDTYWLVLAPLLLGIVDLVLARSVSTAVARRRDRARAHERSRAVVDEIMEEIDREKAEDAAEREKAYSSGAEAVEGVEPARVPDLIAALEASLAAVAMEGRGREQFDIDPRSRALLHLVAEGASTREVAANLEITEQLAAQLLVRVRRDLMRIQDDLAQLQDDLTEPQQ